ncbi:hypothetical protein ACOMHN_035325 [Nucella lapillus]
MADSSYESVLCVKNEVFVYKIPPRPSNRGYRAAEWKLDSPDWTGRLRIVAANKDLFIKLESKDGELFAQCPVDSYPSVAVEAVMDSSRYFVLRIKDGSGRTAFIGIGFADRSDSFDLNVSLQDHFKGLKQEQEAVKTTQQLMQGPTLDLGFKAGQTITLNLGTKRGDGPAAKSKPKPRTTGAFLPPPPGGPGAMRIPPPAAAGVAPPPSSAGFKASFDSPGPSNPPPPPPAAAAATTGNSGSADLDLLMDVGSSDWSSYSSATAAPVAAPLAPVQSLEQDSGDVWGDFASASTNGNQTQATSTPSSGGGWVQF